MQRFDVSTTVIGWRALVLTTVTVVAVGCAPDLPSDTSPVEVVAVPEADLGETLSAAGLTLGEIPVPDLAAIEPGVRRQIEDQRAVVDPLLRDPETARGLLAGELGTLGMLYHVYEMADAADACYVNAETLAPREYRWTYYRGRLGTARGRYDDARSRYTRALSANPGFVPALFWLADALRNLGETERARDVLAWTARENPADAAILVALGQADLSLGDYRAAADRFEAALDLKADTPSIHYGLAMAYRALGRLDASREHFEQSAPGRLYPEDPASVALMSLAGGRGAAHSRAALAMNAGKFDYAAEQFQQLATDHPDDPWAWINLGLARLGLEQEDTAIAAFERALRLDPDQIQAHMELTRVWVRRERYSRAMPHLEAVLRLDPDELAASFLLGTCLLETGRAADAVPHLEAAVAGSPGTGSAHVRLATALCWTDRHDRALAVLEHAHDAMPERALLTEALARLLACAPDRNLRDAERALALIEDVVGNEAMDLAQVQTVAMAHAANDDFAAAIRWQERAIEAAGTLNRVDLLEALENNLERYRGDHPCEVPWPKPRPHS